MSVSRLSVSCLLVLALGVPPLLAWPGRLSAASTVDVHAPLPPPSAGVTDLKFRDMYTLPVGPLGLEPTPRLLALHGKRVRLVGFMVRQEGPLQGRFLLTPIPTALGDEDESLADDLPPTVVLVESESTRARPMVYRSGLVTLTGVLQLGARSPEGMDGRVFGLSLRLDTTSMRALSRASQDRHAARTRTRPQDHASN